MDFINDITKETLVICDSAYKKQFITNNCLNNIKVMTFNEFIKKFYFDYDESAILYVMKKLHVKYDVATVYLKNLYYIKDITYPVKKLQILKNLQEELIAQNKLIYNNLFKNYLKDIKIIFYDLELEDFFLNDIQELDYEIVIPKLQEHNHKVIEFASMEEEIAYVAYQISNLIYEGVSLSKIKLTNVEANYYNSLERIFSLHGLKIAIPYQTPLSSYPYIKEFINNYKEMSLENAINLLDKKHPLYSNLINVINKYLIYDNQELLMSKLVSEYIEATTYENSIEIIDYLNYQPADDEYIFLLSFNDKIIPKSIKDTEYITDNIKKYVGLSDTRLQNVKLRQRIISKLKNIKNLTITYKLQDYKSSYYPSTLCSFFDVIKDNSDYSISYSEGYHKIKLATCIDNYIKYGQIDKDYYKLNANFQINYNSYNNEYHLINRVMDKLTLSYSKLNIYNKCAFRYYLSEILKLDIFEENFSTIIGSMVHYVMEKCLRNNEITPQVYADEYLKEKKFTYKERFFLEKYKVATTKLLEQIMKELIVNNFDHALYEQDIIVEYADNIKFKGIIDKILYKEVNNQTVLALIDYKTGHDDISLKYLKYGINIQLPIYLYLSKYLNLRNIIYSGFYLQKLNITQDDYRLEGYSNSNPEILSYIDKDYDNSQIIKGMKTNKDGSFARYAKVLSTEQIDKIIEITERIIKETIEKIKSNNFAINPKKDNDKVIGCEYCKFKDICFVNNKNYEKITEINFEEVL